MGEIHNQPIAYRDRVMHSSLLVNAPGQPAAALARRVLSYDTELEPQDSAIYGLTDFHSEPPITVSPERSIHNALQDMTRLRIHALLVTDRRPAKRDQAIYGLITSSDIRRVNLSARPAYASDRRTPRVGEVMTPGDLLPLVKYDSLKVLSASDLNDMFQGSGLTHLLVVESHGDDVWVARGLLSRMTIAKRLHASQ